jgi:hypothetical protein
MKKYKLRPYSLAWAFRHYIGPALVGAAVIAAGIWCMGVVGL